MDEMIKSIKNFIYRDIIFILGGSSVILSFIYYFNFNHLDFTKIPIAFYLLGSGFAYVTGYVIQDISSLIPGLRAKVPAKPRDFSKQIFEWFDGVYWKDIQAFDTYEARSTIYEKASEREVAYYERLISLMQVGTTIGPCFMISAIPFIIPAVKTFECFDISLSFILPIIGFGLIFLAWIKAAQVTRFLYVLYTKYDTSNVKEINKNNNLEK